MCQEYPQGIALHTWAVNNSIVGAVEIKHEVAVAGSRQPAALGNYRADASAWIGRPASSIVDGVPETRKLAIWHCWLRKIFI